MFILLFLQEMKLFGMMPCAALDYLPVMAVHSSIEDWIWNVRGYSWYTFSSVKPVQQLNHAFCNSGCRGAKCWWNKLLQSIESLNCCLINWSQMFAKHHAPRAQKIERTVGQSWKNIACGPGSFVDLCANRNGNYSDCVAMFRHHRGQPLIGPGNMIWIPNQTFCWSILYKYIYIYYIYIYFSVCVSPDFHENKNKYGLGPLVKEQADSHQDTPVRGVVTKPQSILVGLNTWRRFHLDLLSRHLETNHPKLSWLKKYRETNNLKQTRQTQDDHQSSSLMLCSPRCKAPLWASRSEYPVCLTKTFTAVGWVPGRFAVREARSFERFFLMWQKWSQQKGQWSHPMNWLN